MTAADLTNASHILDRYGDWHNVLRVTSTAVEIPSDLEDPRLVPLLSVRGYAVDGKRVA